MAFFPHDARSNHRLLRLVGGLHVSTDRLLQAVKLALLFVELGLQGFDPGMAVGDFRRLCLDLVRLGPDLRLLLLERIDKHNTQAIILHAFDGAGLVERNEKRIDAGDILRAKADVGSAVGVPLESDRAQMFDNIQTLDEWNELRLVTPTRTARGNLQVWVEA